MMPFTVFDVQELLDRVLALPAAGRLSFLEEACAGREELHNEV